MSEAEYKPWSRVEDVDVPVHGWADYTHLRIPWVYARTAEGVLKTAIVAAHVSLKAMAVQQELARQQREAASKEVAVPDRIARLRQARYEPPLVHFHCAGCDETWDAWVTDAGMLQDMRDVVCANPNCELLGQPAELVEEDE